MRQSTCVSFGRGPAAVAFPAAVLALVFAVWVNGCGDDAPGVTVVEGDGGETDFGDRTRVVVTDEGTFVVSGHSDDCVLVGKDCVDLDAAGGQYCNDPGAQADIIVVDGEVVEVICYPPADEGTPIEEVEPNEDGDIEVPQTDNGAVIVFDEATDGLVIEGDVVLSAERTSLFGNGSEHTTLGGNVTVASNNSRIRGVTVEGNVVYDENSNNSALSFSVIEGNLTVASNGFSGVDSVVFGNVDVSGNNAVLVNMGVGGAWQVTGSDPICEGCYSIDDADEDFEVDEGENGDPLTCP